MFGGVYPTVVCVRVPSLVAYYYINMADPLLVEHNNTPQQELEPAQQPQQKPKRNISIKDKTVQVEGKDHIIRDDLLKTHAVILHHS
jgi:hypothetical protein